MVETYLTVFIGQFTSIYTAKFYGKFPYYNQIEVTDYPISLFKVIFGRSKYVNVKVVAGRMEELDIYDVPEWDALNSQPTGRIIRIVNMDLLWNKDNTICEGIPHSENQKRSIQNLMAQIDNTEWKYINLLDRLRKGENQDLVIKEAIDLLKFSKKARNELFSPMDLLGRKDDK